MQIIEDKISKNLFDEMLKSNRKIIALFHANWSNVSNKFKKKFEELHQDQYKDIELIIIDGDKNLTLLRNLGIVQLPSVAEITKSSFNKFDDFEISDIDKILRS